MYTLSEQGYKPMRGALTEGRYITIEANGFALTNPSISTNQLSTTAALANHSDIHQRWVVHQLDVALNVPQFNISSAVDGKYISQQTSLSTAVSGAEVYTVTFLGNGNGYTLQNENGGYLTIDVNGNLVVSNMPQGFQFYSVTYNT
jgi:phospholipase C